jgi:ketosteroid isomerase-like protein
MRFHRLLLLALSVGAVPIPAHADEPITADSNDVLKLIREQESAWNKGDLKGFMAGYWNSPNLSFYSGRDIQHGWQQTFERYQKRYQGEGKEMGKLEFSDLTADRLAPGIVLARGRWKVQLKSETLDGLFSLIMEKKPEGWRIVHDHTSAGETVKKQ